MKRESEFEKRKKRRNRADEEIQGVRRRNTQANDYYEENEEEDDDEYSPGNKGRKRKSNMPIWKQALYILIAILTTIMLIASIITVSFLSKIKSDNIIPATSVSGNETVNILILGMDIGDVNQVENKDIKRTDTIMVLNYNPKSKKAHLVSVPRDMLINVNGSNSKINAAYGIGGEALIKSEVEELLSINVNYMVKIDYNAFRSFIDAIGPIEMPIERDMIYDDPGQNLHINFKKGEIAQLDGKKAEEFFRWRKNNDGSGFANGDLDRINNQQKFLTKVVDKCTSPTIVFKIPKILSAISSNIETNIPGTKMISLGLKLIGLDSDNLVMTTVQGTPKKIDRQDYLVFDKKANSELISALGSSTGTLVGANKDTTKILILNGTKINGLASQVKEELNLLGWSKIDVGNTTELNNSVIKVDDDGIKNSIKSDLYRIKKYDKKPDLTEYETYDVVVFLGKDYKKIDE